MVSKCTDMNDADNLIEIYNSVFCDVFYVSDQLK